MFCMFVCVCVCAVCTCVCDAFFFLPHRLSSPGLNMGPSVQLTVSQHDRFKVNMWWPDVMFVPGHAHGPPPLTFLNRPRGLPLGLCYSGSQHVSTWLLDLPTPHLPEVSFFCSLCPLAKSRSQGRQHEEWLWWWKKTGRERGGTGEESLDPYVFKTT